MNKKYFLLKERVKEFIQKTCKKLYILKQEYKARRRIAKGFNK
jgi:hypothetical protein